jgi:protein O-mannosyl-transferase
LKENNKKPSGLWPYLLVTVSVIMVYLPTFSGGFILDDRPLIENNAYVKKIHPLKSYLLQEDGVTDAFDTGDYHTGYYRPLINLTYSIDYKLWGLSAPGFRITNLLLHLLCCILLFKFLQFLINDRYVTLWATLIFALHPVNTEAVSWIGSRDNILAALFSIVSLFSYIKCWETGKLLHRIISVFAFGLAILSKEMGLMVLPLFFLYQRLLSRKKRDIRKELLSYLPFIVVAAGYFFMRKAVTDSFSSPFQILDFWKSVCFAPYLIMWNLKLVFLPYGLHNFVVDYPSATYQSWQAIAGFFYSAFLLLLIWRLRKNKLVIFSVVAFHVLLFPTLNIIPTLANSLISMRWVYFPMAFLTILFARLIKGFFRINGFVSGGVLCAVLAYLSVYSYMLNATLWKNESNFFRQEVINFDNDYYAGGLAENLFDSKRYQGAEKYFRISTEKYPFEVRNYLNYSALLIETGRPHIALVYLKKSEALAMTHKRQGQWYNNMGVAHFGLGKHRESIQYFLKTVRHSPHSDEYKANLGGAYTASGDYEKAVSVLEKALEMTPQSISVKKNLALTYMEMKRPRDAIRVLRKIPPDEMEKQGLQEVFEKAKTDLLRSNGNPAER